MNNDANSLSIYLVNFGSYEVANVHKGEQFGRPLNKELGPLKQGAARTEYFNRDGECLNSLLSKLVTASLVQAIKRIDLSTCRNGDENEGSEK